MAEPLSKDWIWSFIREYPNREPFLRRPGRLLTSATLRMSYIQSISP